MRDLKQAYNLESGEKILKILRKHPLVYFKGLIGFIFLLLLPILIYGVIINFWPDLLIDPVWFPILVMGAVIYYFFVWIFAFHGWMSYYFDMWIITDKRIIDVHQIAIFNREVGKLPLNKIQDAISREQGFFRTIFHYGDVNIKTAGTEVGFTIKDVYKPFEVAGEILDLIKHYK